MTWNIYTRFSNRECARGMKWLSIVFTNTPCFDSLPVLYDMSYLHRNKRDFLIFLIKRTILFYSL